MKDMFGSSWEKNPTKISLELVRNSNSHPIDWLWIIIGDNILCSIKYEHPSIVVNWYGPEAGKNRACLACFPGSTDIEYKGYLTKKLIKNILNKLVEMQRNTIGCLAIELGEFLVNEKILPDTKFDNRRIYR